MEYNAINPKAFSAPEAIKNVMGNTTANPSLEVVDPLAGTQLNPMQNKPVSSPIAPPKTVTQPITPVYGLN